MIPAESYDRVERREWRPYVPNAIDRMVREWDRLDAANAARAKLPPPNGRAPS